MLPPYDMQPRSVLSVKPEPPSDTFEPSPPSSTAFSERQRETLEQLIIDLTNRVVQVERDGHTLTREYPHLIQRVTRLEEERAALQSENERLRNAQLTLEAQLKTYEAAAISRTALDDFRKEREEVEEGMRLIWVDVLREEMGERGAEVSALENKFNTVAEEMKTMTSSLQSTVSALQQRSTFPDTQRTAQNDFEKLIDERLTAMKDSIKNTSPTSDDLQRRVDELKQLPEQIQQLIAEFGKLKQDMSSALNTVARVQEASETAQRRVETAEHRVHQLNLRGGRNDADIAELFKHVKSHRTTLQTMEQKVLSLSTRRQQVDAQMKSLNAQVCGLNRVAHTHGEWSNMERRGVEIDRSACMQSMREDMRNPESGLRPVTQSQWGTMDDHLHTNQTMAGQKGLVGAPFNAVQVGDDAEGNSGRDEGRAEGQRVSKKRKLST